MNIRLSFLYTINVSFLNFLTKKSYTKFADTSHYLFNMTIKEYIEIVSRRLQSGISREHSYRGDLETLIRELVKGIEITNEPANVTDCGNPVFLSCSFWSIP